MYLSGPSVFQLWRPPADDLPGVDVSKVREDSLEAAVLISPVDLASFGAVGVALVKRAPGKEYKYE